MPQCYKERDFHEGWEVEELLKFDPSHVPEICSAQVFWFRGMAKSLLGITTTGKVSEKLVFAEGFFYSGGATPAFWDQIRQATITQYGGHYESAQLDWVAHPCHAVVDGQLFSNSDESSAEWDGPTLEISHPIKGPIYYPADAIQRAMKEYGITLPPPSSDATPEPPDEKLHWLERETLLAIIKVLALEAKWDLSEHYKAAEALAKAAALHGQPFPSSQETIAKKLREARDSVYRKRSQ